MTFWIVFTAIAVGLIWIFHVTGWVDISGDEASWGWRIFFSALFSMTITFLLSLTDYATMRYVGEQQGTVVGRAYAPSSTGTTYGTSIDSKGNVTPTVGTVSNPETFTLLVRGTNRKVKSYDVDATYYVDMLDGNQVKIKKYRGSVFNLWEDTVVEPVQ